MIANRIFELWPGNEDSKTKPLKNGVPQGLPLAASLFYVSTANLSQTPIKNAFADDPHFELLVKQNN